MTKNFDELEIGDKVTVRLREEARYSGYGGRPVCFLEPGEVATVAAIDVASLYARRGDAFCCADFEKHGECWRVAIYPDNYRLAEELGE